MPAHPLLEFFPAVAVFGLSGIGILFPEEGSQKLCGVFSLHAEAEDEEGHSSFTFLGVTDRRSPGKKATRELGPAAPARETQFLQFLGFTFRL